MALPPLSPGSSRQPTDWIAWGGRAAFLAALPTTVWRVLPGIGIPLGTPEEWRAFHDLPGSGTTYVVGLSLVQLIAAACCLALTVDPRRHTSGRAPEWLRRIVPSFIGVAGVSGALLLAGLVTMSVLAWDKVDPFAGHVYDAWAWVSLICYLFAALWPVILLPTAIGYLGRFSREERP